MIIIPIKWLFHWEYTLFSDKPIFISGSVVVLLQVLRGAVRQGAEVYHNLKSVIKKKYGQETGYVAICRGMLVMPVVVI